MSSIGDAADRRSRLSPDKRALLQKRLRGEREDQPSSLAISRIAGQTFPLSFGQQRLWFLNQLEPDSSSYNVLEAYRLVGPLDVAALEQAINEIVRRHEVLRTRFGAADGEPVQIIAPSLWVPLAIVNLEQLPTAVRETEAAQVALQEANALYDLSRGPLFRVRLLRLGNEEHVLALMLHHIVTDGWSMGVLWHELADLYTAFHRGKPSPFRELPVQYADFAVWQRSRLAGGALAEQLAYWKERLEGASELQLPTDRPRPALPTFEAAREHLSFSPELSLALKTLSRCEGVTLFMTLLAAFKVLLYRYTGQEDIMVGTPVANRDRAEIEGLIGFFVNTLVLRTDLSSTPPGRLIFRELLARVKKECLGAFVHQHLPFEKLVEELRPERGPSRNPLFQVMFTLENMPRPAPEMAELTVTPWALDDGRALFDMDCRLREEGEAIRGTVVYNTSLFDRATIQRLAGHYETLLRGVVANPDQSILGLRLLTEEERDQLLVEWNHTQAGYSRDMTVHELFQAQAERTPEAVAVAFGGNTLSYGELNHKANQLARYLRRLGVGPDVPVGLCVKRSPDMIVGQLGILKAGGAFVLLDVANPPERLAFMLADSRVPLLLTQQALLSHLPEHTGRTVCLDRDWPEIGKTDEASPGSQPDPHNLAYVIYTSGSTGQPKGVQIEHSALSNLVSWHRRAFGVTQTDRATQIAGPGFDAAVWEVWPYLSAGASILIPDEETSASPKELRDWLASNAITLSFLPTSLAESVLCLEWPRDVALRVLLTGGDKLRCYPPPGLPFVLVNNYGPTESTVVAASGMVSPDAHADTPPSIGRPIANTQVYVLDAHLQPVPIGVAGELYIGGRSLARGYLNRPEMTAEHFIPNPFDREPGARLYRTGDLARYRPDGNIEFLGRADYQVKIRGFRIEVGEIEAVLGQHPGVRKAVVLARDDLPGGRGLVAYLVAEQERTPKGSALRGYLRERLPEYMVPAAFVFLDALPVTANGKLQRAKLPPPDPRSSELVESFIAPESATELALAAIWAKLLGLERVGIHDSFFDLGGHSLLAAQVRSRIRDTFHIDLPLRTIFEMPTIAELSGLVDQIPSILGRVDSSAEDMIQERDEIDL